MYFNLKQKFIFYRLLLMKREIRYAYKLYPYEYYKMGGIHFVLIIDKIGLYKEIL